MNFPENDGVKYSLAQTEQRNPIEVEGEAQKPATESPKAEVKEPTTAEPAAEAKAEPESKVAEKAEMPKVEESATAKTPEIVKINTVAEITDEDFQKPYRSLELPSLPERTLKAMGKEAKPVLLKQNILVKNRNHHPELSEKDSRETLQKALYENDLVGQSQPSKRPNYWVAVQLSSGKNAVAVLDITETKTHHEIVGWRIINDKSLQALKNQAVREGGQILTSQDDSLRVSSDHTEPGNLSNTVTPEAEKSSEAAGKVEEKAETKDGQPRPDLHDYLDANVNMAAEVEFSEDEEDGEQGDASKVKMSKPWTGEKEEYPAEWGKCFSQYRGKKYLAVQHLLHRKEGFVPAAFHREDIGDIDIVYGETGEGVKDKRGYGLAHIRKRHPGMNWKLFSQVIQTGELKEINDRRVNIVDGKAKVIIELEWKGQESGPPAESVVCTSPIRAYYRQGPSKGL